MQKILHVSFKPTTKAPGMQPQMLIISCGGTRKLLNQEEVAAAVLIYQYMGEKGEEFLRMHQYSQEEVLDGLEQLGKKAGYEGVVRPQGY